MERALSDDDVSSGGGDVDTGSFKWSHWCLALPKQGDIPVPARMLATPVHCNELQKLLLAQFSIVQEKNNKKPTFLCHQGIQTRSLTLHRL